MLCAYIKILDLYCTSIHACIACMATIMVRVREDVKELWVAAAHDERVSLSEWVRRRCDDGLGSAGGNGGETPLTRSDSPRIESPPAVPSPPLDVVAPDENARLGKHSFSPSSRRCGADVARGTRCKLCGEKH